MNTPTTTPQPQHTPTPYSAEGRFIYSAATHYAAPEGNKIAEVIWNSEAKNSPEQDAAFIVRACNSHAQLVAALEIIAGIKSGPCPVMHTLENAQDFARAALTAAQERAK